MNARRGLSDEAYQSLKTATRRQIDAAGGLESAASLTRVSKTELGNYQHPLKNRRFMPIDVAADLAHFSRSTFILEALALLADCVVEPIHIDGKGLEHDMISFGEYASTTFRDYAAVHAGHEMNIRDLEKLDHDLGEVVRIAVHARTTVRDFMARPKKLTRERPEEA